MHRYRSVNLKVYVLFYVCTHYEYIKSNEWSSRESRFTWFHQSIVFAVIQDNRAVQFVEVADVFLAQKIDRDICVEVMFDRSKSKLIGIEWSNAPRWTFSLMLFFNSSSVIIVRERRIISNHFARGQLSSHVRQKRKLIQAKWIFGPKRVPEREWKRE